MAEMNPIVYYVVFKHGEIEKRIEEGQEVSMNEVEEITSLEHIIAIQNELSKSYINPKVINYIPLRRRN